ncbi:MAG TPA: GDSL-type esterase/lipase family protein [Tepidisphaeraceae bacterium]|jgi:beta-glucosidase
MGAEIISDSRRQTSFETLESRRLCSASLADIQVAQPFKLPAPSVKVSGTGTLLIKATDQDESIRIRRLDRRTIELAFTVTLPAGFDVGVDQIVMTPPIEGGIPVIAQKGVSSSTGFPMTAVVPLEGIRRVFIDGGNGHDVLKLARLPIVTQATHVERQTVALVASPQGRTPSEPALHPYKSKAVWSKLIDRKIKAANASDARLAFFGDSHVDHFMSVGRRYWDAHFAGALNLGIGGEGTRQMLYRIRAGQFDHYRPRVLVVTCGSNNVNADQTGTDAQLADGMRTLVTALRAKLPDTKIVMVSVFPRGEAGLNERIRKLNAITANLADGRHVFFLDVFDRMAGASGGTAVRADLFLQDVLHLNAAGYRVLTDRVATFLKTL